MTTATTPSNGNAIQRAPRASALGAMAQRFSVEPEKLMGILKATVIKGTNQRAPTNEEVAAFVMVANQYGLNPFTREIHAFCDGARGVVPIVGIDGWTHIVNGHDQFDGCEFEEEEDEGGKPIKITCTMYVKGRAHPIKITERFKECFRSTNPWNQMPFRMLRHKAFMQAARVAFSISGLYDEDEAHDIIGNAAGGPPAETVNATRRLNSITATDAPPIQAVTIPPAETSDPDVSGADAEPPADPADEQEGAGDSGQSEPASTTEINPTEIESYAPFYEACESAAVGNLSSADFQTAMKAVNVKHPVKEGRRKGADARRLVLQAFMENRVGKDGTINNEA